MHILDDMQFGGNGCYRIPVSSKVEELKGQLHVNVACTIPLGNGLEDVLKHGFGSSVDRMATLSLEH